MYIRTFDGDILNCDLIREYRLVCIELSTPPGRELYEVSALWDDGEGTPLLRKTDHKIASAFMLSLQTWLCRTESISPLFDVRLWWKNKSLCPLQSNHDPE